jgi:two-component system, NarL family, nitrate/nitrite response regulator NarL
VAKAKRDSPSAEGMRAVGGGPERVPLSNRGSGVARDMSVDTAVVTALVSHDRLFRDGVEAILQRQGFSVGLSVPFVKDVLCSLQSGNAPPDVLILVGGLPSGGDEMSALRSAREAAPQLRIIVFMEEGADPELLRHLISIGVDALLPTDLSAEILVQSIRLVLLGEGFMFTEYVHRLIEREPHPVASMPDLTPREIEIIKFMAEGHSNKTIAGWLDLTEASIKVQIRRLLRKIGATNRTQAAIWAMECGLVRADQVGDSGNE